MDWLFCGAVVDWLVGGVVGWLAGGVIVAKHNTLRAYMPGFCIVHVLLTLFSSVP